GADMADTVAFGDSMNDQQMLEYAGVAVAMGNSCQELKDIADIVCESVEEDGVYCEFKRMNLI
ncbi:MAG: HAD hydrolase family protein, partial [Eubacterium sp.]|nr:HAD hydrolase family protein [Eubacterium sp.]